MDFFPYNEIRKGQDKLIADIKTAVESRKNLIAHAPTGLGKTVSVLVPALEYAVKNDKTIFFLTPRHTQHMIVIDTIKKIKEKTKTEIQTVDLIGKRWLCGISDIDELLSSDFTEYCRYLRTEELCAYYNNIWKKTELSENAKSKIDELKKLSPLHAEEAKEKCKNFCPYEIALLLAKSARVIIADYYHIFHPSPRKIILTKMKKELSDCIIVVDEAHNLGTRVRELLSSKLTTSTINKAIKEARELDNTEIQEDLIWILDCIKELEKEEEEYFVKEEEFREKVEETLNKKIDDIISVFNKYAEEVRKTKKRTYLGSVAKFLEFWTSEESKKPAFTRIMRKKKFNDRKYFELEISCLDPSIVSKEVFDSAHCSILMSGTMRPQKMHQDVLGLEEKRTMIKEYESSFPKNNRLVLIVPDGTTKYSERNDSQFSKIALYCSKITNCYKTNMALFFPSYFLRDKITEKIITDKEIILEKQNMKKDDKAKLLKNFTSLSSKGAVLSACTAGSFSEGIDLPGKNLECVAVIGIPLSKPDLLTNSLINYYDKKFKAGWNYGYIYPAMNRTIQAAGRCIRSEKDKGVIILIDKRYTWENYLKCLPTDWIINFTKTPDLKIKEFLDKK